MIMASKPHSVSLSSTDCVTNCEIQLRETTIRMRLASGITYSFPKPFPPDDAEFPPVQVLYPSPAVITVKLERNLDPLDQILRPVDRPADVVLRRNPVRHRVNGNRSDLGLGAVGSCHCRGPASHRLGYRVAEPLAATDHDCRVTGRIAHGEFLVGEFPVLVEDSVSDTVYDCERPDIPVAPTRQRDESIGVNPHPRIEPGESLEHHRPVLALLIGHNAAEDYFLVPHAPAGAGVGAVDRLEGIEVQAVGYPVQVLVAVFLGPVLGQVKRPFRGHKHPVIALDNRSGSHGEVRGPDASRVLHEVPPPLELAAAQEPLKLIRHSYRVSEPQQARRIPDGEDDSAGTLRKII